MYTLIDGVLKLTNLSFSEVGLVGGVNYSKVHNNYYNKVCSEHPSHKGQSV